MNKKALYESIMKNVSIQVKKALNEGKNDIDAHLIYRSLIGKTIDMPQYDFITNKKDQRALNSKIAGYVIEHYVVSIMENVLHSKNRSSINSAHVDFNDGVNAFEIKSFNKFRNESKGWTGNYISEAQFNELINNDAEILAVKYNIDNTTLTITNAKFCDSSEFSRDADGHLILNNNANYLRSSKGAAIGDIIIGKNEDKYICISNGVFANINEIYQRNIFDIDENDVPSYSIIEDIAKNFKVIERSLKLENIRISNYVWGLDENGNIELFNCDTPDKQPAAIGSIEKNPHEAGMIESKGTLFKVF